MTCKPGDLPWSAEGACHASLESGWYGSDDFFSDHPFSCLSTRLILPTDSVGLEGHQDQSCVFYVMLTLILGGARSGKSRFAQSLCSTSSKVAYIATARIEDEEMRARVNRHRLERPFELDDCGRTSCDCEGRPAECTWL